jgi:hypothetical protein
LTRDFRPAAYAIILFGFALAAVAALVPFFTGTYHLETGVFAALLSPFLLYGVFSEDLRGWWLLGSGLVLLSICLALVIFERYLNYAGYGDAMIYWVPLVASGIVLPVGYMMGKLPLD